MTQYIDKATLVAEIEKLVDKGKYHEEFDCGYRDGNNNALYELKEIIDTLEVKKPYEQCVQYDSIEGGIQSFAEIYSFNIESKLFNQFTEEQQKLCRKEIEQAVISGGDMGYSLAKDTRYKENLEVKEVDSEKVFLDEYSKFSNDTDAMDYAFPIDLADFKDFAKHFFELGLKAAQNNNN